MKRFEKVMIGVDLSQMDNILIQKLLLIKDLIGLEKLYIIHVSKNLALPEEVRTHFPDLVAPVDETIKSEIKLLMEERDPNHILDYEVIVEEGNPLPTFLRWAKIKDVDLIIAGRKSTLKGSGSLSKSLAQKAPCSVLFLTERNVLDRIEKVLVPLDFSEHSKLIFEFADRICTDLGSTIVGLHIYEVPHGYYKTGKSYEEFAEIMKGHAQNDFKKFVKKHIEKEFECHFILDDERHAGELIIDSAKEYGADLIIMGSKGRTASASILLGSVAEKLVQVNNEIPMLILKKKGENMGFFEALFKI